MPGDYPSRRQPDTIGTEEKEQEETENKDGRDVEEQAPCDMEEGAVPKMMPAVESEMLKRIRDRTLLEQLGIGSYARYGPGAQRLRPRRPALPPATVRHAPLYLCNGDPHFPPTIIARSSLNGQELLRGMPPHSGLVPSAPPPAVVTAYNPPKLDEARHPPLETPSCGAIVPCLPPSVHNAPTRDLVRNQIRTSQFPRRQLINSRPLDASHINNINPATQYPPGKLAIPRFYENPHHGYNNRLGLSFHPPLVIGFNRDSRPEQEDAHIRPQATDYRGLRNPSWFIPTSDSFPTPPRSFEASAWERRSFTRTKSPRTTLKATIVSQSDPKAQSRSRDYVVQKDLAARLGLPSADQRSDGSSSPECSNPGIPRPIASFLALPSADERGHSSTPEPTSNPRSPRPLVQDNFDRPSPLEPSATPSGLLYLPTDYIAEGVPPAQEHDKAAGENTDPTLPSRRSSTGAPQNPGGIAPTELTGTDYLPASCTNSRPNSPYSPDQ